MKVRVCIDGLVHEATPGQSLAVLLAESWSRCSVSGQARAPLCGMGVCFECRVKVDGVAHQRACQIVVRDGMEVRRER